MNKSFSYLLHKFLSDYLINECGFSEETRKSYSTTFYLLVEFMKSIYELLPNQIEFSHLTYECINQFLDWLENERKSSYSTRNQRLAAIKSFFKYAQTRNPEIINLSTQILGIKNKKTSSRIISYFMEDEIKIIFDYLSGKNNLKYLTMISMLYETGARVQEMINIKVSDINLSKRTVVLHGKGKKNRTIPISEEMCRLIKRYLKIEYKDFGDGFLFYSKNKRQYSRNGVYYVINTIVKELKKRYPDKFNGKYHPHSFRHSIATHMYNNGTTLLSIKKFLGHESLEATQIYATPDSEVIKKQILSNSKAISPNSKYSDGDKDDLETWLKENMK